MYIFLVFQLSCYNFLIELDLNSNCDFLLADDNSLTGIEQDAEPILTPEDTLMTDEVVMSAEEVDERMPQEVMEEDGEQQ